MKRRYAFGLAAVLGGLALLGIVRSQSGSLIGHEMMRTEVEGDTASNKSAGSTGSSSVTGSAGAPAAVWASQSPSMGGGMGGTGGSGGGTPEQTAKLTLASMSESQTDRYLIKNATISIESSDVLRAAEAAKEIAKSVNGYVSGSHETVDNLGLRNVTLEVRVPASDFDSSMAKIEAIGRVLDNQITTQDVTEQYVDTDAQLHNLKETEARLLAHLKDTGKLADILAVESEISGVRTNIDELEGKMRFMSHRITYSTISMTFKEPGHIEPIAPPESFSLGQVASQAMRSVSGFLQSVMSVGVWLLIWSVLWAPLLVGGRYAYSRYIQNAGHRMS